MQPPSLPNGRSRACGELSQSRSDTRLLSHSFSHRSSHEILSICTKDLQPLGALCQLPWRLLADAVGFKVHRDQSGHRPLSQECANRTNINCCVLYKVSVVSLEP